MYKRQRIAGIFVGYHMHPGGVFSGDYYVVALDELINDIDAAPGDVKIHRAREVSVRPGAPVFPIAARRKRLEGGSNSEGARR